MPSNELIAVLRTGAHGLDHTVRFLILDVCDRLERKTRDCELLMERTVELRKELTAAKIDMERVATGKTDRCNICNVEQSTCASVLCRTCNRFQWRGQKEE